MIPAQQVRTSLVIGAAGAAIAAALLLAQRSRPCPEVPLAQGEITVSARLATTKILTGPHDLDIAVTITAPRGHAQARPPLSLAIVVDRSGSMSGYPMDHAKTAAVRMVDALGGDD